MDGAIDKIVEVVYDMPALSEPGIERLPVDGVEQAIAGVTTGPFDTARWPNVFHRVLRCPAGGGTSR